MDPFRLLLTKSTDGCSSVGELTENLSHFFYSGPPIETAPDGTLRAIFERQLVERIGKLRIDIRPNEHPPPHFHVVGPDLDASFEIVSGELLAGDIRASDYQRIRYWHQSARTKLIQIWNATRPADCPVGAIKESA